jgi:hypothetical protein
MTVSLSIAAEMLRDTVAAVALESAILTGESLASDLVGAVVAVAVVIASVTSGNAFAVGSAAEFRSRTLAVLVPAEVVIFIVTIGTIIFKIARPASRNTAFVLALELGRFMARWALFGQLV